MKPGRAAGGGNEEVDAQVAELDLVRRTDGIRLRVVRVEQRHRGVVDVNQVGVVGGHQVDEFVGSQDFFAGLVGHAPEVGAVLGDPAVDQGDVLCGDHRGDANEAEVVDVVFEGRGVLVPVAGDGRQVAL